MVRIIPRLDIKGPNLVKGIHLEGLRVLGDPKEYANFYYKAGADELIFQDVVASLYQRNSLNNIIEQRIMAERKKYEKKIQEEEKQKDEIVKQKQLEEAKTKQELEKIMQERLAEKDQELTNYKQQIKKEKVGNRHPLKRCGESIDIANYTAFLLSDKSSWITGQTLGIDGGMSTINLS